MSSLHRLEQQQKKISQNPFPNRTFLFLAHSFGIETSDTLYVHTLGSSLENHTRFQTKMGKVYTRVQTKTAQNPYPLGAHTYKAYIRGTPPLSYGDVREVKGRRNSSLFTESIFFRLFFYRGL